MTKDTTVGEVTANPALEDFGRLLFPVDRSIPSDMTLEEVSSSSVYVWYSHIQPDKTVEIVNHVISRAEQGEQVFYPIYTEEEMEALGIPTEFHAYEGLGHGFGLGAGTVAEGWIEDTVATAVVTPHVQQTLYLWEEGNAPAVTEYTINSGGYSDNPDFRPYLTFYPVPEGTEIKGAVLIYPGGAFLFRSDGPEGVSVAQALSERGYQSFVADYRLRPYTQQEGALDLARAVRFVRAHAEEFGIDEQDIAVMGLSAGGILAGELPPTFYCYGTRDPFYRQFLANADAAEEAGVRVERLQLDYLDCIYLHHPAGDYSVRSRLA